MIIKSIGMDIRRACARPAKNQHKHSWKSYHRTQQNNYFTLPFVNGTIVKFWSSSFNILSILQPQKEWIECTKITTLHCLKYALTKFNVTNIDENARESKGISSSEKSRHSDDSGPGEKWGFFNLDKKIMYVCSRKERKLRKAWAGLHKIKMTHERHFFLTWPIRGMSSWAKGDTTSTSALASSQVSLIAPSAADSPISKYPAGRVLCQWQPVI